MKHLKKSLSLFLCIVLCLSFFPFPAAYAEENIEEVESVSEAEELEQELIQDKTAFDEDQEAQPHEHSYTAVVTEPTCTEEGYTTYTCDCGDSYVNDYTDALNHPEIIDVPEVPATETESGTTAGKKCAVCGEILEGCEEIPVLEEVVTASESKPEDDSLIVEEEENSVVFETVVEEETVSDVARSAVVHSGTCGKNIIWTLKDGCLTISGTGPMYDYQTEDNPNVPPWYSLREELDDILIAKGITRIGDSAFDGCNRLTSIIIPDSVTSIGDCAFFGCNSLTKIRIPSSVTQIGSFTFDGCEFSSAGPFGTGCDYEFGWTTTIPDFAFSCGNSRGFDSITLPKGITSIGKYAFLNCNFHSIEIPDTVTSIGVGAFDGCINMGSIQLPPNITDLGKKTFYFCDSLTNLIVPEKVISIGENCFGYCKNLKEITIPKSVTTIEKLALVGCDSLDRVYYCGTENEWNSIELTGSGFQLKDIVYVHKVRLATTVDNGTILIDKAYIQENETVTLTVTPNEGYTLADNSLQVSYIENNTTKYVNLTQGTGENSNVWSFTMPAYDVIVNAAFSPTVHSGTWGVLEWTLDDAGTLTISGEGPMNGFSYYSSEAWRSYRTDIKEVILNSGVTSIGMYAFYTCSSLMSITVPEGVTSIGAFAFCDCSSLTSITIPEGVTSIGLAAFGGCSSLTNITIPEGVTRIDCHAFNGCSSLTKITIPESVMSFGYYDYDVYRVTDALPYRKGIAPVFSECSSLKTAGPIGSGCNIEFGWKNKIPAYAFCDCSSLTNVTIPEGVTNIGEYAFYSCDSLTSITIPESVEYIASNAFMLCTACRVYYSGSETQWKSLSRLDIGISNNRVVFKMLDAPVMLKAENSNNGITISWKQKKDWSHFRVFRKETQEDDWREIGDCRENTFTDVDVKNGITYKYRVCCIDNEDKYYSTFSNEISLTRIPAPQTLTAKVVKSGLELSWAECSGMTGYEVCRRGKTDTAWQTIGKVTTANYTDTSVRSGETWIYAVRAYDVDGTSGVMSDEVEIQFLASPIISDLSKAADGVRIQWTKVTGASACRVFRKGANDSEWTNLGDCIGTEYIDKNGQDGLKYSYCLQSVDNNGNVINEASASKEIVYFKTPVITSVNNTSDNALTLSWAASPGVTGYEIQYSVTSYFSQVRSIQITNAATSSTVIRDLLKDKTYYLRIRSYLFLNGVKYYSLWSEPVSTLIQLGKTYIVYFDANGGNGAPNSQTKDHAVALILSSKRPSRDGYTFIGWAENQFATTAKYQPGEQYTKDVSVTLYAVWFSPVAEYVKRCYQIILGREGEPNGVDYWVNVLLSGQRAGAEIVHDFIYSPEFSSHHYFDDETVTILYRAMLGREPDSDGKSFWLSFLNNGTSYNYIINGFSGSQEFGGICSEYGIQTGSVALTESRDQNPQVTAFVMRNYQLALNRRAAGSELNYYCEILLNRIQTPQQVAHNFVFSPECLSRNLNDRDFITMLYRLYMDRDPDVGGMNYYLSALANGATREQVEAGFAHSSEFKRIVEGYGIVVYLISYDANGGTGAPASQVKLAGEVLILSDAVPTRADKSESYTVTLNANGGTVSPRSLTATRTTKFSFKSWNTQSNGSGKSYNPGASYTADADATLYAQWNSNTTTSVVTLPTPTRTNYTFKGWATSTSASSGVQGSYTPTGNVTLYAIWESQSTKVYEEGTWKPNYTNQLNSKLDSPEEWCESGFSRATLAILLYKDLPSRLKTSQFKNALDSGSVFMKKVYTDAGIVSYFLHYVATERQLMICYVPDISIASYSVADSKGSQTYDGYKQTTDWQITKADVNAVYNTRPDLK